MNDKMKECLSTKYVVSYKQVDLLNNAFDKLNHKDNAISMAIAIFSQTQNLSKTMFFVHSIFKMDLFKKLENGIHDFDRIQVMLQNAVSKEDKDEYEEERVLVYLDFCDKFGKNFITEVLAFYNNYGTYEDIMIDLEKENNDIY